MIWKTSLLIASTIFALGGKAVRIPMVYVKITIGPYTKYQSNPTVNYTLRSTYTTGKEVYEIFRFGNESNPNLQTVTKPNHTIPASSTYENYVTIPTKNLLGDSGLKLTVEVYTASGSQMSSNFITIYPVKSETINPLTYSSNSYTCPTTCASITNNLRKPVEETYTFTSIDDYFKTDIYYRLPLDQFVIDTTLTDSDFTYESAELIVEGMEEYFPGLTYVNGKANIPLKIDYDNGKLQLGFLDNLYVEPKLLLVSTSPKSGYKATPYFYLPVNHCDDLYGMQFTISLNKLGYNKSSFVWSASLLAANPLIGDCPNSAYCVVGRVKQ